MDVGMLGMMNQYLSFSTDSENITSRDNKKIYNQILSGNFDSPAFAYFMNLGANRLCDTKSIKMYNESNLAAEINNAKENEEITGDNYTITLGTNFIKIKKKFIDILEERHSTRWFSSALPMSLDELSTILRYSNGIAKRKIHFENIDVTTRNHGSGGGLYPVDMYLVINNVEGVGSGVYRYQPYSHTLRYITGDFNMVDLYPYMGMDIENFSFCVLYELDINKIYVKYGELSLLIAMIETGLIAQNMELISTALGYTGCQVAGFQKKYAENKLCLDGVNSHVIYTQMCGRE